MSEAVAVVIAVVVVIVGGVAFWLGGAVRASILLRPGDRRRSLRPDNPRRDDLPGNRDVSA
jgi:hypothetical protein